MTPLEVMHEAEHASHLMGRRPRSSFGRSVVSGVDPRAAVADQLALEDLPGLGV